jgi:hypothetical protein
MMAMASSVPGSVSMMTFLGAAGAEINAGEFAARTAGIDEKTRKARSAAGKNLRRRVETSEMGPRLCRLSEIHGKQKQQCSPNFSGNSHIF